MQFAFRNRVVSAVVVGALLFGFRSFALADPPDRLQPWLSPQTWERDVDGPVVSLGETGQFDDSHLFAPTVVRENGKFLLWYCGSTGAAWDVAPKGQRIADERVFKLGFATSGDGKAFQKFAGNPVMSIADNRQSILTPCVLRNEDGTPIREHGMLRMWYASAHLGGDRVHTIHDVTSSDGVAWSEPSPPLIKNGYCPSVVKTNEGYQIWYTDVTKFPWLIRYGESKDGRKWDIADGAVITIDQPWEHDIVIYPTVIKTGGVYCMWYGSYTDKSHDFTSLGFAVSEDGRNWHKHPQNPVLKYDPDRPWESNYVTSDSVMRLPDGSFRIWYASRKAPPFRNLYFALNTARWNGPVTEPAK